MEHASHQVDILNSAGQVIGQKKRRDIDKKQDIFHTVYVLLITPHGELVLTEIPERQDLPNLFAGKISVPVASIRRSGETALQAAARATSRELFIDQAELQLVGEETLDFGPSKRLCSVFYLIGEAPFVYSHTDLGQLITMAPREIVKKLKDAPELFSTPFQMIWQRWRSALPL